MACAVGRGSLQAGPRIAATNCVCELRPAESYSPSYSACLGRFTSGAVLRLLLTATESQLSGETAIFHFLQIHKAFRRTRASPVAKNQAPLPAVSADPPRLHKCCCDMQTKAQHAALTFRRHLRLLSHAWPLVTRDHCGALFTVGIIASSPSLSQAGDRGGHEQRRGAKVVDDEPECNPVSAPNDADLDSADGSASDGAIRPSLSMRLEAARASSFCGSSEVDDTAKSETAVSRATSAPPARAPAPCNDKGAVSAPKLDPRTSGAGATAAAASQPAAQTALPVAADRSADLDGTAAAAPVAKHEEINTAFKTQATRGLSRPLFVPNVVGPWSKNAAAQPIAKQQAAPQQKAAVASAEVVHAGGAASPWPNSQRQRGLLQQPGAANSAAAPETSDDGTDEVQMQADVKYAQRLQEQEDAWHAAVLGGQGGLYPTQTQGHHAQPNTASRPAAPAASEQLAVPAEDSASARRERYNAAARRFAMAPAMYTWHHPTVFDGNAPSADLEHGTLRHEGTHLRDAEESDNEDLRYASRIQLLGMASNACAAQLSW